MSGADAATMGNASYLYGDTMRNAYPYGLGGAAHLSGAWPSRFDGHPGFPAGHGDHAAPLEPPPGRGGGASTAINPAGFDMVTAHGNGLDDFGFAVCGAGDGAAAHRCPVFPTGHERAHAAAFSASAPGCATATYLHPDSFLVIDAAGHPEYVRYAHGNGLNPGLDFFGFPVRGAGGGGAAHGYPPFPAVHQRVDAAAFSASAPGGATPTYLHPEGFVVVNGTGHPQYAGPWGTPTWPLPFAVNSTHPPGQGGDAVPFWVAGTRTAPPSTTSSAPARRLVPSPCPGIASRAPRAIQAVGPLPSFPCTGTRCYTVSPRPTPWRLHTAAPQSSSTRMDSATASASGPGSTGTAFHGEAAPCIGSGLTPHPSCRSVVMTQNTLLSLCRQNKLQGKTEACWFQPQPAASHVMLFPLARHPQVVQHRLYRYNSVSVQSCI